MTDMILFILYMWQREIYRKKIGRLSMADKKVILVITLDKN